jgi:hypothetical protein
MIARSKGSQADSAGSIPVTRSTRKGQVRGMISGAGLSLAWSFVVQGSSYSVVPLACR